MTYPLYTSHAHLWPMLAPLESYEAEMMEWCELLESHFGERTGLQVLDLGTGGGHHLYHLVQNFAAIEGGLAVDLAVEMLSRVAELVSRVETLQHDMTTLRTGERYDVVVAHDSFCYLHQEAEVLALFRTISEHLTEGGLAMVKVDAVADSFDGPYRYLTTFEEEDYEVTLTHFEWDPDPSDSWLEVIYQFVELDKAKATTREERHRLGLFSKAKLLELAEATGLKARWHELERWDEERENLLLILEVKLDTHH